MKLKREAIKRIALARNKEIYLRNTIRFKRTKKWWQKFNWTAWILTLATIITAYFIYLQVNISNHQSNIFDNQTIILKKQTDLIDIQNKLFQEQNVKIDSQNSMFGRQNKLVEFQNEKTDAQNSLIFSQNELLSFQNDRISQQTNLQEAERRSSIVYLFSNVLDKIDEELKEKEKKGEERILSTELIARIASLTQALKPYKYLNNDTIIARAVSPEKGQLLSALINFNLDQSTYDSIFKKSNFQNLELENSYLEPIIYNNINLANSVLYNCVLSKSTFNNAILYNVIFNRSIINNVTFNNSNLLKSEMKVINGEKVKFLSCLINDTNFYGSNLKNSIFESGVPLIAEFGEILHGELSKTTANLKILKTFEKFGLINGGESNYIDDKSGKKYFHYTVDQIDINKMPYNSSLSTITNINFSFCDLSNSLFKNYKINSSNFDNSTITSIRFSNVAVWKTHFEETKLDVTTFNENFNFHFFSDVPPLGINYHLVPVEFKNDLIFEITGATINKQSTKRSHTHYIKSK